MTNTTSTTRALALLASLALAACGAKRDAPARNEGAGSALVRDAGGSAATRILRSDVMAALSAGFGAFLAHLEVEPAMVEGKFHGWRVLKLRERDPMWTAVDLLPGDIIASVNSKSIERPEQALAAFQSLAVAPELRVQYERNGAPRELVYPIVDDVPPDGGHR